MLEFTEVTVKVETAVLEQVREIAEFTGTPSDDLVSAAISVMLSNPKESALKRIMRKVRDWQIDRLVVLYRNKSTPTTKSPKPKGK